MTYTPERGDLIWLQFFPQAGHEQSGRRPALVLSPKGYNHASGLAIVCPITSRAKGYPFEVDVPQGLAISGVILADHVRSVEWLAREAAFIGRAPDLAVAEVRDKIGVLI